MMMWAHPRSRGEHVARFGPQRWAAGSSPLTRGALVGLTPESTALGLIPAHAGSTMNHGWMRFFIRAHPRSRGEHGRFVQ
ncbi:hypothetical protein HMPREF3227_01729 [Corynebacterium sp. CMW7794]|nr:hypothetical protein HMPREF3227_01729 [Corynebacterium sp. CMW7794]